MKTLRTPDERFRDLPGFDFRPNYLQTPDGEGGSLRVHYLDEGPRMAEPVLLMHGEPSWCYLYRTMIPVFTAAGYRAVAPDLVGFGRSDKPAQLDDYTYQRHVDWMQALLEHLDLTGITLVCQDWGGLIGLRLVAGHPERFARVVVANTGLPTGDHPMSEAFSAWREYSRTAPEFHVGGIIKGACVNPLSDAVIAAYDAPFPDDTYKAGARVFPSLVPITPDDPAAEANRRAWEVLSRFEKPFLTAFSDGDPITRGGDRVFLKLIPGTRNQPHTTIKGGGHFLQEDQGEQFARVVVDFMESS
ncbi:MAG: haloalkane dehalogenase [Deltaproteobacteria bacterium]|nr:haloalkane dehalogenase [Deltaproteobacteria bacterium]